MTVFSYMVLWYYILINMVQYPVTDCVVSTIVYIANQFSYNIATYSIPLDFIISYMYSYFSVYI